MGGTPSDWRTYGFRPSLPFSERGSVALGRQRRITGSGLERGWWAGTFANGGLSVHADATHETFWFRGHGPRASPMWKKTTVVIQIKINLAACLLGIAAILKVLI